MHEKDLKIAIEIGDRVEEEVLITILVRDTLGLDSLTLRWVILFPLWMFLTL